MTTYPIFLILGGRGSWISLSNEKLNAFWESNLHVSLVVRPRRTPKVSITRANTLHLLIYIFMYLTDMETIDVTGIAFGWILGFLEARCGANLGLKSGQIRSCWQLQFLIPTKRENKLQKMWLKFFRLSLHFSPWMEMGREVLSTSGSSTS